MDKEIEALVDALKLALAEPGEQRLYKSGKLDGLFAGRVGVNGEAAARALREKVEAAWGGGEPALPPLPAGIDMAADWAAQALAYLDHRRTSGAGGDCSLSELFAALRDRYPDLSVRALHDGLRRLHDRGA